jgi:hypothetical protein
VKLTPAAAGAAGAALGLGALLLTTRGRFALKMLRNRLALLKTGSTIEERCVAYVHEVCVSVHRLWFVVVSPA